MKAKSFLTFTACLIALATPEPASAQSSVPVYEYTIRMGDAQRSAVYYHSTSSRTPGSMTAHGEKFRAFKTAQPGTVPVYLFTIRASDPGRTQVYYLSRNASTPPSFSAGGVAFHAYPSAGSGRVPVYLYTTTSGRYYYGTGGPPSAGWTRQSTPAFYGASKAGQSSGPTAGTPSGDVPVYEYTIPLGDARRSLVYYHSTSPQTPGSMTAHGEKFRAFKTAQPGTVPIYRFTIQAADPGRTLIYYLSKNSSTPQSFRAAGIAFHAYPSARSGTVPIYLYTTASGRYYYSAGGAPSAGWIRRAPAFYAASTGQGGSLGTAPPPPPASVAPNASVYEYTIRLGDAQRSVVYYHSTSSRTPGSMTAHGAKFRVFKTAQPGTVPIYRFTIQAGDPGRTLIYYLSKNSSTPPSFRAAGVAFHAYPSPRSGMVPIYLYTGSSGRYYYSPGWPTSAGWTRRNPAFYAAADASQINLTPPPSAPPTVAKSATGKNWQLHMGLSSSEHNTKFQQLAGSGWALDDIALHYENGATRYTSVWRKAPRPSWASHHDLDEASFRRNHAQKVQQGLHLHDLALVRTPQGLRMAGIWRKGSRTQSIRFGLNSVPAGNISHVAVYEDGAGRHLYAVVTDGVSTGVALTGLDGGTYQRSFVAQERAGRVLSRPLIERDGRGIRYGGLFTGRRAHTPPSHHGLDWNGVKSKLRSYPAGPASLDVVYVNDRPWFHVRWALPTPKIVADFEASTFAKDPKLGPVLASFPDAQFSSGSRYAQADVRLFDQPMTLYLWLPRGSNTPNFAVLADNVKLSNLIAPASGTVMDELRVKNAAFLYIPKKNAGPIDVATLPEPVRRRVQVVRTGTIELLVGQNVFAQVHLATDGEAAQAVQDIGMCTGSAKTQQCFDTFHVHAAYGKTKRGRDKRFLRIAHPTRWATPFGLQGLDLEQATLEFVSVTDKKNRRKQTLRAWGTVQVASTRSDGTASSYFMFGQCVLKKCKYQNAFAFNARRMSLDGMKDITNAIGAAVFDHAKFTTQRRQNFVNGLNKLPLHLIRVENSSYDASKNLTADGNPDFTRTMLVLGATQNQRLPYTQGKSFRGPRLKAYGEMVAFDRTVGQGTADVAKKRGRIQLEATGRVAGFKWGKVNMSKGLQLSVKRKSGSSSSEQYAMAFSGSVDVGTYVSQRVTIAVDNSGFDFDIDGKCPLTPFGLSASVKQDLGGASSASLGQGSWSISKLTLNCPLLGLVNELLKRLPMEFGVPTQVGAFTDDLLAEFGYRTAIFEPIVNYANDLKQWRSRVSGALSNKGLTYISPGKEVFGKAVNGGISTVQSVFNRSDISGGIYNGGKSSVQAGNKVANEIGGWLGIRGTLVNPKVQNDFACSEAPNIQKRGSDLMTLRNLRLETSGRISSTAAKPGAAYGCADRTVAGGSKGTWLRFDLGAQTGTNGEIFHVAGVIVSTSGGTPQNLHGGLQGALVIFSNESELRAAVLDPDLVYKVDSDELRYSRVHTLGANDHHYVVEPEQCIAQATAEWRDSDYQSAHKHEPATHSRYVWIYQPKPYTQIRINHLSIVGRNVTGRNNLCACTYVRGPANTGTYDKGTNQPTRCWN